MQYLRCEEAKNHAEQFTLVWLTGCVSRVDLDRFSDDLAQQRMEFYTNLSLKRRNKTQINKIYLPWFKLKADVLKTEDIVIRPVGLIFSENLFHVLGGDRELLHSSAWLSSHLPEDDGICLHFKSKRGS